MPTSSRPNILVIMSDQHSKYQLGAYGDALVRTPHLDRLANEGMRFTNAYTAAPLCVPARMAFMTTRRPSANEVWNNQHILSSAIPTWAHAMGAAGYETALIGRMHFVGPDQRHGFEKRPIGEYSAHHPGAPRLGGPMFKDIPASTSGQTRECVEIAGYGRTTYQAFDEMVADAGVRYLEEKAKDTARPFAAVASFVLPHCPFFAPQELYDYYYERVEVPEPSAAELEGEPQAIKNFKKRRKIDVPLTSERIRVARSAYYGLCEYFDAQVGRLLAALDATGLAENTLVIYCSDHGEMAGEHGCWWKSNYYEAAVGVPLIARLPGVVPEGAVNAAICSLMDLGATAIDIAGAEALPRTDGHSLWRLLQGEADTARPDETYSEMRTGAGESASRMLREGPWKIYKCHDDTPPVLFNIEGDPGELHDLGQDPAHAELCARLLQKLYEDWDPDWVERRSDELELDGQRISAWGKVVLPSHDDTLSVPDVEEVVRC
ncbi:MAG: sulfatase-like hydrolase/transferase [Candidatus Latescibacterota bacterium]|jgi:choline-sulfatase